MKKISLIGRILIALVIGILLGVGCKSIGIDYPIRIFGTFAGVFGNFLSFMIPLIIIGFIVPGIASLGGRSGKGLLITTALAYISTIVAGFASYLVGRELLPKFISGNILLKESATTAQPYFTLDMPPIIGVMSALVLAFVLGMGLSKIKNSTFLQVAEEFSEIVMMVVSKLLIPIMPIYIGCIFAKLSFTGEILTTLKSFAIVYVILLSVQALYLVVQYSIAGVLKKENPFKLLKNMVPAYLTALGTQSSAATIPITREAVSSNGVSEEVTDFVVPLAATIHLAGDTITLVLTAMGVMYMNGQVPTLRLMVPFILMLGITMVAAPGVPGGGVMSALGILESMLGFGGLEKPIMIALHAAQDSFGTATNVTGDGALAIIVDYILNRKKDVEIEKEEEVIAIEMA